MKDKKNTARGLFYYSSTYAPAQWDINNNNEHMYTNGLYMHSTDYTVSGVCESANHITALALFKSLEFDWCLRV